MHPQNFALSRTSLESCHHHPHPPSSSPRSCCPNPSCAVDLHAATGMVGNSITSPHHQDRISSSSRPLPRAQCALRCPARSRLAIHAQALGPSRADSQTTARAATAVKAAVLSPDVSTTEPRAIPRQPQPQPQPGKVHQKAPLRADEAWAEFEKKLEADLAT